MYQALLDLGRDVLPQELAVHLVGVFFEKERLILQIDQSIWATQLRFYEPSVLGVFQESFPHLHLKRVLVKVVPPAPEPEKRPLQMEQLSKQNALQMRELSEHIESPDLKAALQRLSRFQQNNQTKK